MSRPSSKRPAREEVQALAEVVAVLGSTTSFPATQLFVIELEFWPDPPNSLFLHRDAVPLLPALLLRVEQRGLGRGRHAGVREGGALGEDIDQSIVNVAAALIVFSSSALRIVSACSRSRASSADSALAS